MARPRYVLDTNVLMAAALPPVARPHRRGVVVAAVVAAARARGVLLLSPETWAELEEVAARPVFDRYIPAGARRAFVAAIRDEALVIEPPCVERLCRDATDDKFLALALAGQADALVTQDKAVLSVERVGSTRILHPNRFALHLGLDGADGLRAPMLSERA